MPTETVTLETYETTTVILETDQREELSVQTTTDTEVILIDSGTPGTPGVDKYYPHYQLSASAEWDITHNLGKYPCVEILDSAGNKMGGDIQHLSSNRLVVRFTAAFAGSAHLN